MSPSPDPAEPSSPADPIDNQPRPLLGARFWALMAFAAICVLGGAAVATFGPHLLAPAHAPHLLEPPH